MSMQDDLSSPDIEPDVIKELALAANAIQIAARCTKWGFVSDHCANALVEIKKAIVQACGRRIE